MKFGKFSLFEKRSTTVDPIHPGDPGMARLFGFLNGISDSGVSINANNAPEIMAVMACVRVISETMGCLPLVLYKRLENDDKERATSHTLYNILRYQPNGWQTWSEFAEMITAHVLLRGKSYAEIYYDNGGKVKALIPLHPDRMMTYLVNGQRAFRHTPVSGPARTLLQGEVLYIPGLTFDGVSAIDPIAYARNGLGLARVTELYGSKFFANDARPGIVLEHSGLLSDQAHKNLRESWEERHRGGERSHKPAILEEGMTIKEIGVDPDHAQFLETRKFQKDEICGMFRVPPHMIGNLDKATFSNIEHQSRSFIDYTMLPWFTRFEQAVRRDLLSESEKQNYFAEFLPDALLRGDTKSRYDAYAVGRNWGWLSVNDIRRKENLNRVENGDVYLQPLNMQDAGMPVQKTEQKAARAIEEFPAIVASAAERVIRKEINGIRAALECGTSPEGLEQFYQKHRSFVRQTLGLSETSAAAWCYMQLRQISNISKQKQTIEGWDTDGVARLVQFIKEELSDET